MEKGFTLIELLVSVAIVSLLAAMAVQNYDEYRKAAIGSEMTLGARSIYSTLLLLDSEKSASGLVDFGVEKSFSGGFSVTEASGTIPSQNAIKDDFIKSVVEINEDKNLYVSLHYTPSINVYSILILHCKARDRIFYSKNSEGFNIPSHLPVEDNSFKVYRWPAIGYTTAGAASFYSGCS